MEIKSAEFTISSSRADMCPKSDIPEYAFIGRSNVGLINMLTKKPKLAMTSSTPGKTLLINHFLINKEWFLVDLPGYGFALRGKKMMEKIKNLIEYYVLEREQLTCLFVLIDSRHEPQKIDLEFRNNLYKGRQTDCRQDKTERKQLPEQAERAVGRTSSSFHFFI